MATQIFVNLPVRDPKRSMEFFGKLGYAFNPQFTDDNAAAMVIDDGHIYAMLLREEFFATFITKAIADATKSAEVILSLSCDSREKVDEVVHAAVAAGATAPRPAQDHGWMYQWGYQDLDGHLWEVAYMDLSKFPARQ
jgi:predicted lactoylglutathione lyase